MGNLIQLTAFERLEQVGRGLWVPKSPRECPLCPFLHVTPGCQTLFLFPRCDP